MRTLNSSYLSLTDNEANTAIDVGGPTSGDHDDIYQIISKCVYKIEYKYEMKK